MDIIQRNLFRLLRSGAYGTQEQLEPMSVFKWERLYQIAMLHDVIPYAYKGISNCRSQFFMHLTDKQELIWKRANDASGNVRMTRLQPVSRKRKKIHSCVQTH